MSRGFKLALPFVDQLSPKVCFDMRRLLEDAGFVDVTMTETVQWEDIDTWIDTWETPAMQRAQIRDLYHHAPAEVRAVHPFEIGPDGRIRDGWRWCVFSGFKP